MDDAKPYDPWQFDPDRHAQEMRSMERQRDYRPTPPDAAVLAPSDPAVVALTTLSLQLGATCQAIQRIASARRKLGETPAAE